jgi:hypothetical protein
MPVFAYITVVGTALVALLSLFAYVLPDIGSAIKTSQMVGLPKIERGPEAGPLVTTFNFGAPKNYVDTASLNAIYAKDIGTLKQQNVHSTKRQSASTDLSASHQHRAPIYSYDAMLNTR